MATSLEVVDKLAANCGGLHGSKYVPGVTQLKGWIGVKGSTQDTKLRGTGYEIASTALRMSEPSNPLLTRNATSRRFLTTGGNPASCFARFSASARPAAAGSMPSAASAPPFPRGAARPAAPASRRSAARLHGPAALCQPRNPRRTAHRPIDPHRSAGPARHRRRPVDAAFGAGGAAGQSARARAVLRPAAPHDGRPRGRPTLAAALGQMD